MMRFQQILIALIYILFITGKCLAVCYFPPELQGSYLTQSTITENQIQYSEVNITGDSIPIWGLCHKRVGNNVLLSSDETECYRCFNLKLVSKNILRVTITDPDFISKCYTNEDKAFASCPSDEILSNPLNYTKIIHYKFLDMDGNNIRYEYCPINGRYKFNYNNDDGKEDVECASNHSELDNCPSGSAMNLRFKECFFENHELRLECLGHWIGLDGKNYLALVNNGPYNYYNHNRHHGDKREIFKPQYRCGIFEEDSQTGSVTIQFSKDSKCSGFNTTIKLKNNTNNDNIKDSMNSNILNSNSETFVLYPANRKIYWPHEKFCTFPSWLLGEWQHITVKNDTFIFRDQISFKSYTMKCVKQDIDDTILVYSRTQCDEESYKCLKIKHRTENVIEFQISAKSSSTFDSDLCSDDNFDDSKWLTQGHRNETYVACPVSGILEGMIPDAQNLCARLISKCTSQDVMHYEVSVCNDNVLEEREYRCLGQWVEKQFVFTYTKRLDIQAYECFIGAVQTDNQRIFIKEAGEHCQRNIDPLKYGMGLKQIETCLSPFHHSTPQISMITESVQNLKMPKLYSTSGTPKLSSYFLPSATISNLVLSKNSTNRTLTSDNTRITSTPLITEINRNKMMNTKDEKLTSKKNSIANSSSIFWNKFYSNFLVFYFIIIEFCLN